METNHSMEDNTITTMNFTKQIQVSIFIVKFKTKQLSSREELESVNSQLPLPVEQFMKENGLTTREMDMVAKNGQMALDTKAIGEMIRPMALVVSITLMETSMKESGWTIKPTVMASIPTQMAQNIKDSGKKTSNTGRG